MDARTDDKLVEPDVKEMNDLLLRLMAGVNGQAFRALGNRVLRGPFAGMIIPPGNTGWDDGNASTKLVGSYEHELHDTIRTAVWRRPDVVVNVGCAEGYYAIGLARLLPKAHVLALDIDPRSLSLCDEYARLNEVADRLGTCLGCDGPNQLDPTPVPGHRLYVVDIEGAETMLTSMDAPAILDHSDIIVECHDFLDPDISFKLAEHFCQTHRVEMIRPCLPNFDDYQFLNRSPTAMTALVVVEKRPMPTCWLACWAIKKGRDNG